MKTLSRIAVGLCSAALMLSMTAIAAGAENTVYEATSDNVKMNGRNYYEEKKSFLWIANSAAGIEFKATGTTVTLNMRSVGDKTRIAVFVNGKVAQVGNLSGSGSVTVALTEGQENTVKLVKLSEAMNSTLGVANIVTDGTISPAESKEHLIEFIGDSITCGYGADGTLGNGFNTTNENAAKAYAYQTGLRVDADVTLMSASGNGIYSCYTGGDASRDNLIKEFYGKYTTYNWNNPGMIMDSTDWDFSVSPDLIVINLGTNDWSYFSRHEDEVELYRTDYVEFIKMVRASNPNAHIMCVLGNMGDQLFGEVEGAVADYTAATGDENVSAHNITPIDPADGYAVDYHPTPVSHAKAADEMAAYIHEELGWDVVVPEDDGLLTTEDNLVQGEFAADPEPETDPSSDDSQAPDSNASSEEESSQDASSEESSAAESSSSQAASSSSSQAASSAASNNTTNNPATGTAAGLALIAAMGGAVIAVKRKK